MPCESGFSHSYRSPIRINSRKDSVWCSELFSDCLLVMPTFSHMLFWFCVTGLWGLSVTICPHAVHSDMAAINKSVFHNNGQCKTTSPSVSYPCFYLNVIRWRIQSFVLVMWWGISDKKQQHKSNYRKQFYCFQKWILPTPQVLEFPNENKLHSIFNILLFGCPKILQ